MFFELFIFNKCGNVKLLRFFLLGFESRKWMVGMCVVKMLKNWYSLYLLLVYVCYYFY